MGVTDRAANPLAISYLPEETERKRDERGDEIEDW